MTQVSWRHKLCNEQIEEGLRQFLPVRRWTKSNFIWRQLHGTEILRSVMSLAVEKQTLINIDKFRVGISFKRLILRLYWRENNRLSLFVCLFVWWEDSDNTSPEEFFCRVLRNKKFSLNFRKELNRWIIYNFFVKPIIRAFKLVKKILPVNGNRQQAAASKEGKNAAAASRSQLLITCYHPCMSIKYVWLKQQKEPAKRRQNIPEAEQ